MNVTQSIAVLPFINMSSDKDNEYFCDGITEEIINALTKIEQLKVIARTSSFVFKGKDTDVRIIGKQLGVSAILEGSIRKSQKRVRISAQLINTKDGMHFWSKKYDRELIDIFDLEDEISLAIAEEVRNNFGHFEIQGHLVNHPTQDVDAYQLYLKGRALQLQWTPDSFKEAISYYNQAIALDKKYAMPYYANLQCYGLLAIWGFMPEEEAMELAISNLMIAKDINNTLPEYPLSFVGRFFWGEWDFKNAYIHIRQVLDISPKHIDGLEAMVELCIALGAFDKAHVYAQKLIEVDPLSSNNHYTLSNIYYYQRDFKKALDNVNYALILNPAFELAQHLQSFCLIWLNRKKEFELSIKDSAFQTEKQLLFEIINEGRTNLPEETFKAWSDIKSNHSLIIPFDLYGLANEKNSALAITILKEKINLRRGQVLNFRHEPFLDVLKSEIDFNALHESTLAVSEIALIDTRQDEPNRLLNDEELIQLKEKLLSYFEEEDAFLDPQLNLKAVSAVLNINTNKVSYLINTVFKVNFNDFINSYRLKHFKSIASDPKNAHITILGLAYDSGFNSKSVFNTYFKKVEGQTPKAWLNAQKP